MQYHQKCDIGAVSPRVLEEFLTVANELQTVNERKLAIQRRDSKF